MVSVLHWPHLLLPPSCLSRDSRNADPLFFFFKWALTVCTGLSTFHVFSLNPPNNLISTIMVSMLQMLKEKHGRLSNLLKGTPLAADRAGVWSPWSQPVYNELPASRSHHLRSQGLGGWLSLLECSLPGPHRPSFSSSEISSNPNSLGRPSLTTGLKITPSHSLPHDPTSLIGLWLSYSFVYCIAPWT